MPVLAGLRVLLDAAQKFRAKHGAHGSLRLTEALCCVHCAGAIPGRQGDGVQEAAPEELTAQDGPPPGMLCPGCHTSSHVSNTALLPSSKQAFTKLAQFPLQCNCLMRELETAGAWCLVQELTSLRIVSIHGLEAPDAEPQPAIAIAA